METRAEKANKAAECLTELNRIIEAQRGQLERQRSRIEELQLQVAELRHRNARLQEEYQRHLLTCNSAPVSLTALGAIQEKSEYGGFRIIGRHASLPVEASQNSSGAVSPACRRILPGRQWKSASFGSVDTLHQYCCPPPLYNKQLAVPAPLKECRDSDDDLHQFCCPPSGSSSPSR